MQYALTPKRHKDSTIRGRLKEGTQHSEHSATRTSVQQCKQQCCTLEPRYTDIDMSKRCSKRDPREPWGKHVSSFSLLDWWVQTEFSGSILILTAYIKDNYKPAIEPASIMLPMYVHKGKPSDIGARILPHFYLPPYRWLHCMYHNYPGEFYNRIAGSPAAITEFWQSIRPPDPKWTNLPAHIRNHPDLLTKGVPIILHGDGVPCSKQSLQATSFSSLTALPSSYFYNSTDYIFSIS